MICNRIGCKKTARWQLGFRAYALGYPKSDRTKAESYIGIAVCDDHKIATRREDIISPQGAAQINNKLQAAGRAPLDLANAEPIFHELIDGKLFQPGQR